MSDTSADENILSAANSGELFQVVEAIEAGANINAKDEYGFSALMSTCLNGNLNITELLIKYKVDLNAIDNYGRTALMYASQKGFTDIVKLLLINKADVDLKNSDGFTALMLATSNKKVEIVQLLISNGANLDNASSIAFEKGFMEILNVLKSHSNQMPNYDSEIIYSAKNNNFEDVKKAINIGADVNKKDEESGMTALMYAAQNGNLPMVEFLLNNDAMVDAKRKISISDGNTARIIFTSDGDTALMFACGKGNLEIVKLLIKNGADINAETIFTYDHKKESDFVEIASYGTNNQHDSTALISASKNGHLEVVQFLIKNKVNVNRTSQKFFSKGNTALIFASTNGHFEIVKLLLENKADVHIEGFLRDTALMSAIRSNYFSPKKKYLEIIKLLLEKNAEVNVKSIITKETALMIACKKIVNDNNSSENQRILVKLLIDRGADVNSKNNDGKTALMLATESNDSNIIALLSNLPSPTANNDLLEYADKGDLEGVKNALAAGADVDVKNKYNEYSALTLAISKGHVDIVKILLEKNANPNKTVLHDRTPLMFAVSAVTNKSLEIIKLLLKYKASLEAQNSLGMTPLIITCIGILNDTEYQQITLDIITLLLDAGANINIANKKGMTALMYAVTTWFPTIVQILVNRGAKIYVKDKLGRTAFMHAARSGSLKVIQFLFEQGIDLNDIDKKGNTALMFAAQNGHLAVVQFLIANNADATKENQDRNNALSLAIHYGANESIYANNNNNIRAILKRNPNKVKYFEENNINMHGMWDNKVSESDKRSIIALDKRLDDVAQFLYSLEKDNK